MTTRSERENLIEKIKDAGLIPCYGMCESDSSNEDWDKAEKYTLDRIADFIIEEKKKIVEPLISIKGTMSASAIQAIDETLKNAGVE